LRREPEHISIRSDRRVGFPRPKAFEGYFRDGIFEGNFDKAICCLQKFLSRFWPGRPGIRNAVMLSDVDAAVTSQAGVLGTGILDLPFVKSGAAGRWIPWE
jgi:hypothetical protein